MTMQPAALAVALCVLAGMSVGSSYAAGGAPTPSRRVSCEAASMSAPAPTDAGVNRVLGKALLPAPSNRLLLVRAPAPRVPLGWKFAKFGLRARNGAGFVTLEVPRADRATLALTATGVPDGGAYALRLEPCADHGLGEWTLWAGGFLARRPGCYTLIVRTHEATARVRLALGAPC